MAGTIIIIVVIIGRRQAIARLVDADATFAAPQELHPLEAILFRAEIAPSRGAGGTGWGHCE